MSRFAPGPRRGAVPIVPREPAEAPSLEDLLEGALTDALGGDPPGPQVARRLERIAREILLRHGLGAARVVARSDAHETVVHVLLPPAGPQVRELRLRIEGIR